MKTSQTLFHTSEFAKICGTTRRTLFYYDEIGILKPAFIDEKGARYYHPEQRMTYMIISSLKDLGLELKEIRAYMTQISSEDFREILEIQKKNVQSRIEHLEKISTIIDTRLHLLDETKNAEKDRIAVKICEEEYYILSAPIQQKDPLLARSVLFDHLNYCHTNHIGIGHPFAAMISCDNLMKGITDVYSYYCTKTDSALDSPFLHRKPAGRYVVSYLYGDYRNHEKIYRDMMYFIQRNGYKCFGYSYKEGIADEVSERNVMDYITKISIPVK